MNFSIQLARSKKELEQAYGMLCDTAKSMQIDQYANQSQSSLWLNKYCALPTTSVLIATSQGKVIAAICVIGDNQLGLPAERFISCGAMRASGARVAEVSHMAIDSGSPIEVEKVRQALWQYLFRYSTNYFLHDYLISMVPNADLNYYKQDLHFENTQESKALAHTTGMAFSLSSIEQKLPQAFQYNCKSCENFIFPERKFFHTSDNIFTPEILDYFFNQKSRVLHELNDHELRVFKNIYDYGEYSRYLPKRNNAESGTGPRHRRYHVKCDGLVYLGDRNFTHVTVQDVSNLGLRIIVDDHLTLDTPYALRISIGIWKNTELIAKPVWRKDNVVGLEILSADDNWQKLIHHLENDFVEKVA